MLVLAVPFSFKPVPDPSQRERGLCVTSSLTVQRFRALSWVLSGVFSLALLLLSGMAPARAQTQTPLPALSTSAPAWQDLTSEQQLALAPLASYWPQLSALRKRKWLAVSSHFDQMSDDEKAKLHDRMTDWAQLSAQERTQARLNFAAAPKLSNDAKLAHWEAYQSLSAEDREKFVKDASPKPTGAAIVIKPVPAQKLTTLPDASKSTRSNTTQLLKIKATAKIDVNVNLLNSHTLLPKAKPL